MYAVENRERGLKRDLGVGFFVSTRDPDGSPGEPPTLSAAVPNSGEGDTIHLGQRTLRRLRPCR